MRAHIAKGGGRLLNFGEAPAHGAGQVVRASTLLKSFFESLRVCERDVRGSRGGAKRQESGVASRDFGTESCELVARTFISFLRAGY